MVYEAFERDLKLLLRWISPPGQNPLAGIAVAFGGGMQGVTNMGKGGGNPRDDGGRPMGSLPSV